VPEKTGFCGIRGNTAVTSQMPSYALSFRDICTVQLNPDHTCQPPKKQRHRQKKTKSAPAVSIAARKKDLKWSLIRKKNEWNHNNRDEKIRGHKPLPLEKPLTSLFIRHKNHNGKLLQATAAQPQDKPGQTKKNNQKWSLWKKHHLHIPAKQNIYGIPPPSKYATQTKNRPYIEC